MPAKRTYMPGPERKLAILQAAAPVFAARGYRGTSVQDITEAAGISKGTFYLYFRSRQEAFVGLIESFFEEFASTLKENHLRLEAAFEQEADVLATWRENALNILRFHRDNPYLSVIVYREALGRDEDFASRFEELNKLARKLQRDEFAMMADRGLMRNEDIDLVASINIGAVVDVIMEFILGKKNPDIESLADKLFEYHARALAPPGIDIDQALGRVVKKSRSSSRSVGS